MQLKFMILIDIFVPYIIYYYIIYIISSTMTHSLTFLKGASFKLSAA